MLRFGRKNKLLAVAGATALSLSLVACGSTGSNAEGGDDGAYTGIVPVYTPRQGGSAYILGGGIANQLSKTVDGVQGSVESTTGTQEMIQRLTEKQAQGQPAFAITESAGAAKAVEGTEPFSGPHTDLRALSNVQESVMYMVTRADSGLDSFDDLKGKQIGMGVAGSPINYLTKEVLAAHGVEEGSYDEQPLGYQEVADGLANGSLDAGVIAGAPPVSALTELAAQHDVAIVGVDPAIMEPLTEEAKYLTSFTSEPGVYQGIDEPVETFAFGVTILTHTDTPDELVQGMMEILFEQTDALAQVHSSANDITIENSTKAVTVEYHPVAEAYLKEQGADIP